MLRKRVVGTALTGTLRVSSDNHWASDVLVGQLMGYASGYLLPTLLYYRQLRSTPHDHDTPTAPFVTALPMVTRDSLGVGIFGTLW